jgi:putative transposase
VTTARKTLISVRDTPYYHVVSRCVRRAWLWGVDEYASRDYSHRKAWVLERLRQLASVFAIDVCAYAVMSNHYHLVLHVAQERAAAWSDVEVVERWTRLFSRPPLIERWQSKTCISDAERDAATHLIGLWRSRLVDVSWYMRCLNEYLARRANQEENCKGRFWEGRFKSQALLDEAGLLTAMAYVDLNPVRAGMVGTLEQSPFTSVHQRIRELTPLQRPVSKTIPESTEQRVPLMPFADLADGQEHVPFSFPEYVRLLNWTARARTMRDRREVCDHVPVIAQRLKIDSAAWHVTMTEVSNVFGRALGRLARMRLHAKRLGQRWIRGQREAQRLYVQLS